MNQPTHNLDTYRTLFLVKGVLTLFLSLLPLIYVFMGVFLTQINEFTQDADPMPSSLGWVFVVMGLVGFVLLLALGIVTIMAAKSLKERKNYTFIFVVAALNCVTGVLGILLGVFSIIDLIKPEVKMIFEVNK